MACQETSGTKAVGLKGSNLPELDTNINLYSLILTTEFLAPSSARALDGLSCLTFTFIFALWPICARTLAPSHTSLQSQAMTLFVLSITA